MYTFIEGEDKHNKDALEMFDIGDMKYINNVEESEDTDVEGELPASRKRSRLEKFKDTQSKLLRKIDNNKFDGFMNYKDLLRNKYPDFEIKEINENLTYFQKIISSRYFYYIILYKIISWTLKGIFLIYMFFYRNKDEPEQEKAGFLQTLKKITGVAYLQTLFSENKTEVNKVENKKEIENEIENEIDIADNDKPSAEEKTVTTQPIVSNVSVEVVSEVNVNPDKKVEVGVISEVSTADLQISVIPTPESKDN